jgi:hypothetical protein
MKKPHFGMLPEKAFQPRNGRMAFAGGGMTLEGCCGPSPSPAPAAPTQTTVQNTNIPCYAKPYVQTMLGATTQQLFNTTGSGCCIQITGVKPYVPYSTNPQDYVAGFSPLQQKAQQGAANLTAPGQIGAGTGSAARGSMQALNAGQGLQNTLTSAQGIGQYMNPYIQNVLQPSMQLLNQQYGQQQAQEQGQATGAGAFGGSREALMSGLNQQNQMLAQNQLVGNAYNTAYNNAQQQATNVAGMNLQGGQAGISGGQALGQLGTQCLAAQMNVLNTQSQAGAQQQANQQQVINNAINNYAVAQQYPQQQLAFMNAQLRGLPLQSSTVQQYNAAPSAVSQAAGIGTAGIAGLGLYNAMSGSTSSDIRAKENIKSVGLLPNGLPVYEFEYKIQFKDKAGHGRYRGVMAHEVEKIMPEAVNVDTNGYKLVNYSMLGIKMEEV